jgi:acetyl esterase
MATYRDDPRVDPAMRAAREAYDATLAQLLPNPPSVPDDSVRAAWDAARANLTLPDPRDFLVVRNDNGGGPRPRSITFTPSDPRPDATIFWLHGGGWCVGGANNLDAVLRRIATLSGTTVVAMEYRLAPEHPFPAALDDVAALFGQPAASRVVLGGDSAGGNLALAFALTHRPKLAGLALAYPVTDCDLETDSYREFAEGYSLLRAGMDLYFRCYAGATDRADPRISPLRAPSLKGLPPVHLQYAGIDVLRDDSLRLHDRLRAEGVPVETHFAPWLLHGYLGFQQSVPLAHAGIESMAAFASRCFG